MVMGWRLYKKTIFSTRSIEKQAWQKFVKQKNTVARLSVENIEEEVEKIYRGLTSVINLSTTGRTSAKRQKDTMKK